MKRGFREWAGLHKVIYVINKIPDKHHCLRKHSFVIFYCFSLAWNVNLALDFLLSKTYSSTSNFTFYLLVITIWLLMATGFHKFETNVFSWFFTIIFIVKLTKTFYRQFQIFFIYFFVLYLISKILIFWHIIVFIEMLVILSSIDM